MSNYRTRTFNPETKKYEDAYWFDDYFGRHQYGVQFVEGITYTPEEIENAEKEFLKLK